MVPGTRPPPLRPHRGSWCCSNLGQGPRMASSPLQRPSPYADWGGLWRQERLSRLGRDRNKLFSIPQHPPKGAQSRAGINSWKGGVRRACHSPLQRSQLGLAGPEAPVAPKEKQSQRDGKFPVIRPLGSSEGTTEGTGPNLHPKPSFPSGFALELLPEDVCQSSGLAVPEHTGPSCLPHT